jgi:hypothetical protein
MTDRTRVLDYETHSTLIRWHCAMPDMNRPSACFRKLEFKTPEGSRDLF